MQDHNSMIAVLMAHRDGKPLQFRDCNSERGWEDLSPSCFGANFTKYEYRIKPEPPKPREGWVREEVLHTISPLGSVGYIHVKEVLPCEEGK